MAKPLYLALSGGGGARGRARGRASTGWCEAQVPIAGIAGVSGGALVAAAWAGGADLDNLVDQASRLHPWMWVRGWGGGLLSGTRLGLLIDEFLPVTTFEGLRVPVRVLATDVDTRRAGGLPRGRRARRGARLLQLPRRLPAHGRRTAAASTTAASPRWCRCGSRASMAGEGGRGAGGRLQRRHPLAERRLVRGAGAARRPHAAARPHARRAVGRRPGDRARPWASRAGCSRARSPRSSRRAARACARRCPELRRLIAP